METIGCVVEEAEDGGRGVFVDEARVVLVREVEAIGEGEGGGGAVGFADKLPKDGAVLARDLVDGAGVAGGDEVVACGVFVNRVDVEVVPWLGGVEASAGGFCAVRRDEAVGREDVVKGGPLEKDLVGVKGDFLKPAIHDPTEAGGNAIG